MNENGLLCLRIQINIIIYLFYSLMLNHVPMFNVFLYVDSNLYIYLNLDLIQFTILKYFLCRAYALCYSLWQKFQKLNSTIF